MAKTSCLIFANKNLNDRLTFPVAIRLTTWPMPNIIRGIITAAIIKPII